MCVWVHAGARARVCVLFCFSTVDIVIVNISCF